MKETLNKQIFKMMVALILVITLVLLFVVWNNTSRTMYQNLESRLSLSETVLIRELINQQQDFTRTINVLFDDFGFKRAIASGQETSIFPALYAHRNMVGSEFISIANENGVVISSSGRLASELEQSTFKTNIGLVKIDGSAESLIILDNNLVWISWLPINDMDGSILAYSASGFVLTPEFLSTLKELIGLDISLYVNSDTAFLVSSLATIKQNVTYLEQSLLSNTDNFLFKLNSFTNDNTLFSRKFSAAGIGNEQTTFYISADATESKEEFLQLQFSIGAISLIAILLTMLVGRMLAKKITQPLEYITKYAVKISKGDYTDTITLDTQTIELEQLLTAFKTMEKGVQQRESEIVFQAEHDMLTNLYNRDFIKKLLDQNFKNNTCFQAVGINILGFRGINDVFGYQYGDICLQELADRVKQLGGTSARLTGGEILWIPDEPLHIDQIKNIKNDLETEIHTDTISLPMKTSVGIIECPIDTQNSEDLFRRMNIVIDEAQMSRKLILKFDNSLEEKYLRRLAIINKLKNALLSNSQELTLHYQPKLCLKTNNVEHAEALIRWEDKELGFISPDEFINIAEHAGFINVVTQWVLTRAVRDVLAFRKQGVHVCIAVNISAQDLLSDNFMNFAAALLDHNKLDHKSISFELTEGVIVREPEKAIRHMQKMRDEGFHLAIDDFGTGYSSLSYLAQMPVNILKIDKCFVIPLAKQKGEQAICQAVLSLAKNFKMQVVAEGVEDAESLQLLTEWGCELAQGYHICRPKPADDFVKWMHEHQSTTVLKASMSATLPTTF